MSNNAKPRTFNTGIVVKPELLDKLKCCECSGFLSTAPVYETPGKRRICGRCPVPEGPSIRAELYEELAGMMAFPCMHKSLGCQEDITFGNQEEHDKICEYVPFDCPVILDDSCDWEGPRKNILKHCEMEHPKKVVLLNPCEIRNNISKSSFQACLITAFGELFLLHIKICTNTKKLYHSVRYIGDEKDAQLYSFKFKIHHKSEKINKTGQVSPQGKLKFNPDNSVPLKIGTLLDVFGSFEEFTTSVWVHTHCGRCYESYKKLVYHTDMGWICPECIPIRRECKNRHKGCQHMDDDKKTTKHEDYYCKYSFKCCLCDKDTHPISLEAHRLSTHINISQCASYIWKASLGNPNTWHRRIMSSQLGTLYCCYYVDSTSFRFRMVSPLRSSKLKSFRIWVQIIHPGTKMQREVEGMVVYDDVHDYLFYLEKEELLFYVNEGVFNLRMRINQ